VKQLFELKLSFFVRIHLPFLSQLPSVLRETKLSICWFWIN